MNLFAQIRKVDEEKRLVYGRAAEEVVDKSGEMMDYLKSKPHFQKWSADVAADSGGKSLGNVRAMHGKVAAGVLKGLDFNDPELAVDVCAHIVDDQEWKKVLTGTYTGFSIGGRYVSSKVEKIDGRDVKKYVAEPNEISLVDRPCMGGATFFEIQKADGTLQKVDFAPAPEPGTVEGTPEQVDALVKLLSDNGLTLEDVLTKAMPAYLADKAKNAEGKTGETGETGGEDEDDTTGKPAAEAAGEPKPGSDKPGEGSVADTEGKAEGAEDDAAKAAPSGDLQKAAVEEPAPAQIDAAVLQKMIDDRLQPLEKQLADAQALIKKLGDQPAPARVALFAVSKSADVIADDDVRTPQQKLLEETPLVKREGQVNEAASLIKFAHRLGGAPLTLPQGLHK